MKHLKLFENFNDDSMSELLDIKKNLERRIDDYFDGGQVYSGDRGYQDLLGDLDDIEERIEELEKKKDTIEDYPQSIKMIYKRFSPKARNSIDDNLEKFAKIAKKVFYYDTKPWKDYFKNKEVKNINTLTDAVNSLEEWMK